MFGGQTLENIALNLTINPSYNVNLTKGCLWLIAISFLTKARLYLIAVASGYAALESRLGNHGGGSNSKVGISRHILQTRL